MVENQQLAVGAQGGRGDEGFSEQHGRVGNEVPRCWVVGAVKDEVVGRKGGGSFLWRERLGVCNVAGMWIESRRSASNRFV